MSFNRTLPVPTPLRPPQNHSLPPRRDPTPSVVFDQNGVRRYNIDMVALNQNVQLDIRMEEGPEIHAGTVRATSAVQQQERASTSSPAQAMDVDEGIPLTQQGRSGSVGSSNSNVSQQFAMQRPPSVQKGVGGWPGEASQVCLCQPEPKVPRPRNAFILYRQHNQAAIVASNPTLSNPEISKVIGNLWSKCAPEEKNHWKALYEEEKIRHAKQYPGYRYQPKRPGAAASKDGDGKGAKDGGGADGDDICARCGGRALPTPSTAMLTGGSGGSASSGALGSGKMQISPRDPSSAGGNNHPPYTSAGHHKRSTTISGPQSAPTLGSKYGNVGVGPFPQQHQHDGRKYAQYPPPIRTAVPITSPSYAPYPRPAGSEQHTPRNGRPVLSPDPKRRRMVQHQQPPPSIPHHTTVIHPNYGQPMPRTPYPFPHLPGAVSAGPMPTPVPPGAKRQSLPRADFLPHHHHQQGSSIASPSPTMAAFPMGPPLPRGSVVAGNEKVTLPPLQLVSPRHGSQAQLATPGTARAERSKEGATVTIPVVNKLKTLGQIAPPMSSFPGQSSESSKQRGIIIAVEGDSVRAVASLTNALKAMLASTADGETIVKVFDNPDIRSAASEVGDPAGYMPVVQEYHALMRNVATFITPHMAPGKTSITGPASPEDTEMKTSKPNTPTPADAPHDDVAQEVSSSSPLSSSPAPQEGDPHPPTKKTADTPPLSPLTKPSNTANNPVSTASTLPPQQHQALHIALLPSSLLSLTNAAAASTSVADAYGPQGNWMWFASIWRGIAGPDLAVVITSEDGNGGHEVEVQEEVRAVIIKGKDEGASVGEGAVRRAGFEVGEWVRGW